MNKKIDVDMQRQLIQKMITQNDYNRAKFVLQNANDDIRVRKNLFQFYQIYEIKNSAYHIILNYENPFFTFDKMRTYVSDEETVSLLKSAVPQWIRAVNAMFRARSRVANRQK